MKKIEKGNPNPTQLSDNQFDNEPVEKKDGHGQIA
jgi:hypothetical protein